MWADIVKSDEQCELEEQNESEQVDTIPMEEPPAPTDSESDLDSVLDDEVCLSKRSFDDILKGIKGDNRTEETFGWDCGNDQSVFAQEAIKRFRLKRLKSLNDNVYYFDNVYNFIWQYAKDDNNVEHLYRPREEIYGHLRMLNEISAEPFLAQPVEFW